jgi:pyridoxamine 5'-phosphate oxidase-like protein
MSTWREVEEDAPDFAERVRRIFESRKHKALATLRSDGSPRISGIELEFQDGEVILGMMPDSLKLKDVRRDPRLAIQGMSDDPVEDSQSAWGGDAKIAGLAVAARKADGRDEPSPFFRVDITEVVLTRLGEPADHLVIESWHPGRGLETRRRD